MTALSHLLRFTVRDGVGGRARLADLVVDLATGDYPPVTAIVIAGADRQPRLLPWSPANQVDWKRRRLRVPDLETASSVDAEDLESRVLLGRDVLDALVLDLQHRHATRANDLWLELSDNLLWLRAADVGAGAVLRRLTRGLLGHRAVLLDWKEVEFLRGDPRAARLGRDYHRRVARLPPAEIAHLVDAIPYLHAAELLTLIPDHAAATALEAMRPERQLQVFEELDEDQAPRLLARLAPDAAADLLGHLHPEQVQQLLELLPARRSALVVDLLRYPPDSAGGIMTNDIVRVPARLTVGEARGLLRERLQGPDFVYFVYLVDDDEQQRLHGVVSLRDLVLAGDERPLAELTARYLVTVDPLEPAGAAARRVIENGLVALPVVAADGRLLGAVTFDAAMARVAPTSWAEQVPRVFS